MEIFRRVTRAKPQKQNTSTQHETLALAASVDTPMPTFLRSSKFHIAGGWLLVILTLSKRPASERYTEVCVNIFVL